MGKMGDLDQKGKWYVVQTLSGQENKVHESIKRQLELNDSLPVYEVNMPMEMVSERRQGKDHLTRRKLFPGYIFVRMDLYNATGEIDEAAWFFIRNIQGIIGFIGGDHPVPLSGSEVAELFRADGEAEQVKPKIVFEIGEVVRIKSGAFENFEGTVDEIDNERSKLKLMVSIFGRSTPVELEFWQVSRDL